MFGFLKSFIKFRRSMKELSQRNRVYQSMAMSDLKSLPDDELFDAVITRTTAKIDSYKDIVAGVNSSNGSEKAFYIAFYYEMEVNNGGLCQYFVNSSRELAPLLANALSEIGAVSHKELFESFIEKNAINIHDLSSFVIHDVNEYEVQANRYPFNDFDNAFYDLPPIQDLLIPYIKKHISDF